MTQNYFGAAPWTGLQPAKFTAVTANGYLRMNCDSLVDGEAEQC